MTTKEKIIQESMKLFAVHGFYAVSIRAIAKEVGVESSALYKHFKSKQAIFDAIVNESEERFLNKYKELQFMDIKTTKDMQNMCMTMFLFQTQDSWVTMFRRMLILEMYNNENIREVFKRIFVDMPIQNQKRIFEEMIGQGKLRNSDAEVLSMELYAPFFLYHIVPAQMESVEPLLRQHVENFVKNNMEVNND